MVFAHSYFIKPEQPFHRAFSETNSCSLFYRVFSLPELPERAVLNICALGIGYAYINGVRISSDLFAPPCADYNKTLWYMAYDVTDNLKEGSNTIAVLCGNGFLSEDMKNGWDSQEAEWRDHPKLICEIIGDGETILNSDDRWLCSLDTSYLMNRFRQGVTCDLRRPMPDSPGFSAKAFTHAKRDDRAPKGVFRRCEAEPIREMQQIAPVAVRQLDEKTKVYDFGLNLSGYVRLHVKGKQGEVVTVKYSEEINADGSRKLNGMDGPSFYEQGEFAVERLILSGEECVWSTLMSYYGFRFAQISCEDSDAVLDVSAVFVHEDIVQIGGFECSDPFLNKLYECGIQASKCNFFYMPTDCPTREKYGWMNDAQSSAEQFLTSFRAEKMLTHWNQDIRDAFDDEKGLPGIVPTHGWGYHWGNGPVSDGSLFEQAYRIYLHTGIREPLVGNLPFFERYFAYLERRCGKGNYPDFGLYDWANPQSNAEKTPLFMINGIYMVKFNRIASIAAGLAGQDSTKFDADAAYWKQKLIHDYLDENGVCTQNYQTAVAMMIYHEIYDELQPLRLQLKHLVEESGFRHDCGMVGLRHLYMALNKCGLQEYAMRIIAADGFPSYRQWLDRGATALWEKWDREESKNHQMYSDVLSWMVKTLGGIGPDEQKPTFDQIEVRPWFTESLDFVRAHYDAPKGRVSVAWNRQGKKISISVCSPCEGYVFFGDAALPKGESTFDLDVDR